LSLRKSELARVHEELSRTEGAARNVEQMIETVKECRKRQSPRSAAFPVMAELYALLPEDVFLDKVEFDAEPGKLTVSGTGGSTKDIGLFIKNLEGSSVFGDAKEDGSTMKDKESRRWRFRVSCGVGEGS
jgi:Tfp pilus assembly protein PilN